MSKFLIVIFLIVFQNAISQNSSFTSTSSIGSKIVIEALDYSNAVNKYYFDEDRIDELVIFLSQNADIFIEVNCFTDFEETPLLNMMATTEQAEAIRTYLVKKGIAGTRIRAIGNGDMFPIIEESVWKTMSDTEKKITNNKNRRIEIIIIKKGS